MLRHLLFEIGWQSFNPIQWIKKPSSSQVRSGWFPFSLTYRTRDTVTWYTNLAASSTIDEWNWPDTSHQDEWNLHGRPECLSYFIWETASNWNRLPRRSQPPRFCALIVIFGSATAYRLRWYTSTQPWQLTCRRRPLLKHDNRLVEEEGLNLHAPRDACLVYIGPYCSNVHEGLRMPNWIRARRGR